MMVEETILKFCGVENIPSFDHPQGGSREQEFFLGHACQGEQIPHCLKFYQGFFQDFTEKELGEQVCIPKCRRKP